MPGDIFSVAPPAWLTEASFGDTQANAARATGLGIAARREADQSKLMGLRVQAAMLASQTRIQALENANASAAMRLQMQEGQIKLAKEKFDQSVAALTLKETDTRGFIQNLANVKDPEVRAKIVAKNPNFMQTGASPDQWSDIKDYNRAFQESEAARLGLKAKTYKDGEVTYSTPTEAGQPEFVTVGNRSFMRWGTKHYDLNDIPAAQKVQIDVAKGDLNRADAALSKIDPNDPAYVGLLNNKLNAQAQLDGFLKPHLAPVTAASPAALPGAASQSAPGSTGMVRVQHPDGRTGTIPAAQLDAAKQQGFTPLTDTAPANND